MSISSIDFFSVFPPGVADRLQALDDAQQKILDLGDTMTDLSDVLKSLEDKMADHESLGAGARDTKHLATLRVRQIAIMLKQ